MATHSLRWLLIVWNGCSKSEMAAQQAFTICKVCVNSPGTTFVPPPPSERTKRSSRVTHGRTTLDKTLEKLGCLKILLLQDFWTCPSLNCTTNNRNKDFLQKVFLLPTIFLLFIELILEEYRVIESVTTLILIYLQAHHWCVTVLCANETLSIDIIQMIWIMECSVTFSVCVGGQSLPGRLKMLRLSLAAAATQCCTLDWTDCHWLKLKPVNTNNEAGQRKTSMMCG